MNGLSGSCCKACRISAYVLAILLLFAWSNARPAPGADACETPRACQAGPAASIHEDCTPFDTDSAEVRLISGDWKIVASNICLEDFYSNATLARKGLAIIKHYRMNSDCYIGRPFPPMQYYLVDGKSPDGPFPGENCTPFDPGRLVVKQAGGKWKIFEGDRVLIDFRSSETNARTGLAVIRKYGFTKMCFVMRARTGLGMMYFRK